MKKNYYVTKKLVSLALAVMLSSGSMFATAMAATVPVGATGTHTATTGTDVFYFNALGTSSGNAEVKSFDVSNDYISVNLPSGFSLVRTTSGSDTKVSMVSGSSNLDLFTVKGVTVPDARVIDPTQPVIFNMDETGITNNIVNRKSTFTLTPTVTLANGSTDGITYSWKQGEKPVTSTPSGELTVNTTDIDAGKYKYSLTVTANGKTANWSKDIDVKDVCTPTFTGVTVTVSPDSATVTGGVITEIPLTSLAAQPIISATNCTFSSHDGNHGITFGSAATYSITSPVQGVSINATNNKLIVNGSKLSVGDNSVTVTATMTSSGTHVATQSGTKVIKITKDLAACDFEPKTLEYSVLPDGTTINGDITTQLTYTAGKMTGDKGTSCTHTVSPTDAYHGKTIEWTVTKAGENNLPAGVSFTTNGNDMTLNIDKTKLTGSSLNIAVKAAVKGPPTASVTKEYTITKTLSCTKTITGMGSVSATNPSSGSTLTPTGGNVLFVVNSATATVQMNSSPVYDNGICEYENNKQTCPNTAKHTVVWSMVGTPSISGISLNNTTGLLTVNYSQLSTTQNTTITVKATGNSKEQVGYIVVQRGTLPSTGGSHDNSEEQRNEQQWNKLEDRFEDADTKDTVRMSLGDNTDIPVRVLNEIVGRNVNVELSVTGGYTWYINGKNLKKPPVYQLAIGLGVESVKNKHATSLAKGNAIEVLELEHNGTFYGTYTLEQKVDSDYRNKHLYLYKYDDNANKLYYRGSAKVDSDGYVKFPFTSASTYVMTDKALYGEKPGSTTGGSTGGAGSSSGGASVVVPPASSVAPPPVSSSSSSQSSSSSETSSSEIELPSSSSEVSRPTDAEPDEPEEEPAKKSIPLIVPILLVVVTITIIAVILLAKGGMNIGN